MLTWVFLLLLWYQSQYKNAVMHIIYAISLSVLYVINQLPSVLQNRRLKELVACRLSYSVAWAGGELSVYLTCSSGTYKARCLMSKLAFCYRVMPCPDTWLPTREQPHSCCREHVADVWDLGALHCSGSVRKKFWLSHEPSATPGGRPHYQPAVSSLKCLGCLSWPLTEAAKRG